MRVIESSLIQKMGAGEWRLDGMHDIGAELIEENAISASDAGLPVPKDIPGETKSRSDVIQIVVRKLDITRQTWIAGEQNAGQGVRVDLGANIEMTDICKRMAMVFLVPGQVRLPASAHCQS